MIGHAEKTWLILISLTLLGSTLGETGNAGWLLTLTVAFLVYAKGSIVIDFYMELRTANQRIRNVLRLFMVLVPVLIIISYLWAEEIRQLTTLD